MPSPLLVVSERFIKLEFLNHNPTEATLGSWNILAWRCSRRRLRWVGAAPAISRGQRRQRRHLRGRISPERDFDRSVRPSVPPSPLHRSLSVMRPFFKAHPFFGQPLRGGPSEGPASPFCPRAPRRPPTFSLFVAPPPPPAAFRMAAESCERWWSFSGRRGMTNSVRPIL